MAINELQSIVEFQSKEIKRLSEELEEIKEVIRAHILNDLRHKKS